MRVLVVAEVDPARTGSGAERVLDEHARALHRRGHAVTILSGGARAATRDGAVTVEPVGWSVATPWRVRRAVARLPAPPDAVVLHHPYPGFLLFGARALGGAPVTLVYHSPWHEEMRARRADARLGQRDPAWHRAHRRPARAPRLSAEPLHGRPTASDPRRRGRARAHRARRRRSHALRAARRPWRGPRDPGATRGRPRAPHRPQPRAAHGPRRAAARDARDPGRVSRRAPRRRRRGRSSPRRCARRREALGLLESVSFPGFVPEADLPALYGAADLSVVPSQSLEGFGLATLESLACGTPGRRHPGRRDARAAGPARSRARAGRREPRRHRAGDPSCAGARRRAGASRALPCAHRGLHVGRGGGGDRGRSRAARATMTAPGLVGG